jgi:hypothetical protein
MKNRKRLWLVFVMVSVAVFLTVMGVAAQNAVKVPVVVHEYLVSSDEGEPSFPGDNLHVRCAGHETIEMSENVCVNGLGTIDYLINFNKNGHVYAGGTWVIEPFAYEDEGAWEMRWHVTDDKPIVAVGRGTGVLNGMSLKLIYKGDGVDDDGGEYMIFTGEILVPPNVQVPCAE